MSTPMEQNGGGDATGGDALQNPTRKRKQDQSWNDYKEESNMLSKGDQAALPICNEGWFYERLIKYYNRRRKMKKAGDYIEKPGTIRRELENQYYEQMNSEIEQETEKEEALNNNLKNRKDRDKKQEDSDEAEKWEDLEGGGA